MNPSRPAVGDGGAHWRAMKVKRIYEQAEREGRPVEVVALERFDSLEEFELARQDWEEKFKYTERSIKHRSNKPLPSSSADREGFRGFRRPTEQPIDAAPKATVKRQQQQQQQQQKQQQQQQQHSITHTVTLPQLQPPSKQEIEQAQNEVNKLQAKLLRSRMMMMMNSNASELAELEQQMEAKSARLKELRSRQHAAESVAVLQPFDSRGRYQDLGGSDRRGDSNDRRASRAQEDQPIAELMQNERLELQNKRSFDDEYAEMLAKDGGFDGVDLEYLENNADRLSSKPVTGQSAARKRARAIADYNQFKAAVDRCWYCFDSDRSPQTAVISSGTRVYLAVPKTLPIVDGHCLIVPMEHRTNTLECDEDEWTEIRNYQKCLMRAFHARQQGVIFMETAMQYRRQHHAVIECIPLPWDAHDQARASFKTSILAAAEEWAQHRKLIETSRERSIRRSMVSNLPYFHVWFDADNGYGHVIEQEEQFPQSFGREIVAGMLQLPVAQWRKPRLLTAQETKQELQTMERIYTAHDWTGLLAADAAGDNNNK